MNKIVLNKRMTLTEDEVKSLENMLKDEEINKLINPILRKDKFTAIVRAIIWCFEDDYCKPYLLETIRLAIARKLSSVEPYIIAETNVKKAIETAQKRIDEINEQIKKLRKMGVL